MYIMITIQIIYAVFCVYYLWKKLQSNLDISDTKMIFYLVTSCIILLVALIAPVYMNSFDKLMRGFAIYISLYLITIPLVIPDQIIKNKQRETLVTLSNYILLNYVVLFLPLIAFNLSNILPGVLVVGKQYSYLYYS